MKKGLRETIPILILVLLSFAGITYTIEQHQSTSVFECIMSTETDVEGCFMLAENVEIKNEHKSDAKGGHSENISGELQKQTELENLSYIETFYCGTHYKHRFKSTENQRCDKPLNSSSGGNPYRQETQNKNEGSLNKHIVELKFGGIPEGRHESSYGGFQADAEPGAVDEHLDNFPQKGSDWMHYVTWGIGLLFILWGVFKDRIFGKKE